MQNIDTDELFPLRNSNYKLATLLIIVLIAYALYAAFFIVWSYNVKYNSYMKMGTKG